MEDRVVVVFKVPKRSFEVDLDIPIDISANELIQALNIAYGLQIDMSDAKNCYLKAEKPIVLLKGNKTLAEFGIRNGTEIYFTE